MSPGTISARHPVSRLVESIEVDEGSGWKPARPDRIAEVDLLRGLRLEYLSGRNGKFLVCTHDLARRWRGGRLRVRFKETHEPTYSNRLDFLVRRVTRRGAHWDPSTRTLTGPA